MTDLRVRLEAPEFAAQRELVGYAVLVENTGRRAVSAHLQGRGPVHDLLVTGAGGEVVWRRLEGSVREAILRLESLAPGESLRMDGEWDQRDLAGHYVEPGFYTLQASVPTDSDPLVSQDRLLQITD